MDQFISSTTSRVGQKFFAFIDWFLPKHSQKSGQFIDLLHGRFLILITGLILFVLPYPAYFEYLEFGFWSAINFSNIFALSACLLVFVGFKWVGNQNLLAILFMFVGIITCVVASIFNEGINDASIIWISYGPLIASFIAGPTSVVVVTLISLMAIIGLSNPDLLMLSQLTGVQYQEVSTMKLLQIIAPLFFGAGLGGLFQIFTSMTQKNIQEFQKQSLKEREAMFSSQKLASLGEMAGGIAHEINSPLTIIDLSIENLKERLENENKISDEIRSTLDRISKTNLRISEIVKGLVRFSRNETPGPFHDVDVNELTQDTLGFCKERFESRGIDLRVTKNKVSEIYCQPVQISQVLLNLLNNSFDAVCKLDEKWVEIDFSETDHVVQVSVTDSGLGVSQSIQDKIMDPFFTTKEVGKGTGLGLSVSHNIMKNNSGTLELNKDCKRTQFVLRFSKNS